LLPGECEALEREYNLRIRHPERNAVYARMASASARLRADWPGFGTHAYGPSAREVIDFFPARVRGPAPLLIFIHGGYWRALDRDNFLWLARAWLDRGVHVAFPEYDLAPAVTVSTIVNQMRAARDWLLAHASALGIDTRRIVVSGHSAGGHLGALVLDNAAGWQASGFVGISGLYDLRPLLATSVNRDARMSPEEATTLSPMLLGLPRAVPVLCAAGGAETDGFRAQSSDLAARLTSQGLSARYIEPPGRTHFDVLDELADPDAPLFQASLVLARIDHQGA
jgi:arylformamidase